MTFLREAGRHTARADSIFRQEGPVAWRTYDRPAVYLLIRTLGENYVCQSQKRRVFRGTRVPFQNLLDYLEAGQTLDEFLDDFPTVTREAAVQALEHAKALVVNQLR